MVSVILIILGVILALAGIAGCLLPVIPGPIVSYLALIVLSLAKDWQPFGATFLIVMGVLAVLLSAVLDYAASMAGARKYGATKAGIWGSAVGMIIGIFFFPPVGIFLGAIAGAVTGELIGGKETRAALRAGWGVIMGSLAGMALKLAYCVTVLFFYLKGVLH
ncbi:MAG: DUF456 domain-containing protein [Thermodesulfobacteriota bacterium]